MAVRKINESTLTAIGNAIRSKTGGSALINPEDMATEIESIQAAVSYPFFKSYERIVVEDTALESGSTQNIRDRYMPVLPDSQTGYPNIFIIVENTLFDTDDQYIGLAAIQFSSPWGGLQSFGRYFARRINIATGANANFDFHVGQGSVIHKFTFDRDRS